MMSSDFIGIVVVFSKLNSRNTVGAYVADVDFLSFQTVHLIWLKGSARTKDLSQDVEIENLREMNSLFVVWSNSTSAVKRHR